MVTKTKTILEWIVAPPMMTTEEVMFGITELAKKYHKIPPRILGKFGTIDSAVTMDGWKFEPLSPESIISSSAQEWLDIILKSGFQGQVLIGHELTQKQVIKLPWKEIKIGLMLVSGIALAIGAIAIVLAILPILFIIVAVLAVGIVDPSICLATSDGTWVEVFKWYE